MFTIIYIKDTGKVVDIRQNTNLTELIKSLPETKNFIEVNTLPSFDIYRQYLVVKQNNLIVEDCVLTPKREREILYIETTTEIKSLITKLKETDYKVLKYIDGEYTEEEYAKIKQERQSYRMRIRELEEKIKSLGE